MCDSINGNFKPETGIFKKQRSSLSSKQPGNMATNDTYVRRSTSLLGSVAYRLCDYWLPGPNII